ncbi:hypothetical protein HDU93_006371, partial [Gonapodya sp. JEL0774]
NLFGILCPPLVGAIYGWLVERQLEHWVFGLFAAVLGGAGVLAMCVKRDMVERSRAGWSKEDLAGEMDEEETDEVARDGVNV